MADYDEMNWAQLELMLTAWQIESVQENMAGEVPVGLQPGTLEEWYAYRGKVKKWNSSHPDWPDSTKRPAKPTAPVVEEPTEPEEPTDPETPPEE